MPDTIAAPLDKEKLSTLIRDALHSQLQPTKTVLSSLLAIQDAVGYITDEAVEQVAGFCSVTLNDVWSVACFYTNFRFTPPGAHTVEICWGPTCHLMGAQRILRSAHKAFGVDSETETSNGSVSLRYNTCLGACGQAPVISVDHKLIGGVTTDLVSELAASLLSGRKFPTNGKAPK